MTFGEKLKSLRKTRNLTQDDMAEILSTSKQVISRYENNQRTPKITIATKYAEILNVPALYLIDDDMVDIQQALLMESPAKKPAAENDDRLTQYEGKKKELIEKIMLMDDDTIVALNQIADSIISKRDK